MRLAKFGLRQRGIIWGTFFLEFPKGLIQGHIRRLLSGRLGDSENV